ncbi:MAG: sigma-54-dependent transcriptional regulator [Bacteroidota bacterium]
MNDFIILLIDDEESQREPIAGFLRKKGYKVFTAFSGETGLELFKENTIDLIITDYKMPGMSGAEVLIESRSINPEVPVIITTAYGNIEGAVELMREGAFDYIQKPIELSELLALIEKARERQSLLNENKMLKIKIEETHDKQDSFTDIIAGAKEMREVLSTAARVADSKASVLLRGESGTGKELIARAVHKASGRCREPFIVVNCAALPETLFESELFGHEKGAFTGADKQRLGRFEQASGGTLFIDEIGDIPLQVQVKMLRALQFGQIERIGGNKLIDLDVRIISATNRNLEEMIQKGDFREDLYYRINVVSICLPPLRSRKSDIPPLIDHFIDKYSIINNKKVLSASKEATDLLMKHSYPGNIRELENIIQRAVVLTRDEYLKITDLPDYVTKPGNLTRPGAADELGDLNRKVEQLEISLINRAMEETAGNQVKAAELLNISERTLRYKIGKYGLK